MTTFVCKTCGQVVEAVASQAWHRCQGKRRELRPVERPPGPETAAQGPLRLF